MLDKPKVLQALQQVTTSLFHDISDQLSLAYKLWLAVQKDPTFAYKVREAHAPWLIPSWSEPLGTTYALEQLPSEYNIFSVDGSQIYPDRHQGTSCYLINIGTVHIHYNSQKTTIALHSEPHVFVPTNEGELLESTLDYVNCTRQDFEFKASLDLLNTLAHAQKHAALLFDGSLVFWHLEGKDEAMKQEYSNRYFQSLYLLYQQKMLTAGYISMPKSKEIVNLLKLALCDFDPLHNDAHKKIDHVLDAHLMNMFLPPQHYSILFKSNSLITELYPSCLKPYFFYLNTGFEIARIEVPAWIAQNNDLVNSLSAIILDQTGKGRGYPVCLAEAHEQAVVKGPDREFFYHLIQKIGIEHQHRMHVSQKSMKKRGIGI